MKQSRLLVESTNEDDDDLIEKIEEDQIKQSTSSTHSLERSVLEVRNRKRLKKNDFSKGTVVEIESNGPKVMNRNTKMDKVIKKQLKFEK